jgi:hypothetical protein
MLNAFSGTPSNVPPVPLGNSADDDVILAKNGITNVVGSDITGNIAVSPIAAGAMTGFGLVMHGQFE